MTKPEHAIPAGGILTRRPRPARNTDILTESLHAPRQRQAESAVRGALRPNKATKFAKYGSLRAVLIYALSLTAPLKVPDARGHSAPGCAPKVRICLAALTMAGNGLKRAKVPSTSQHGGWHVRLRAKSRFLPLCHNVAMAYSPGQVESSTSCPGNRDPKIPNPNEGCIGVTSGPVHCAGPVESAVADLP